MCTIYSNSTYDVFSKFIFMIFYNLSLCLYYLNDYPTIPLKYFKTYNLTVHYIT